MKSEGVCDQTGDGLSSYMSPFETYIFALHTLQRHFEQRKKVIILSHDIFARTVSVISIKDEMLKTKTTHDGWRESLYSTSSYFMCTNCVVTRDGVLKDRVLRVFFFSFFLFFYFFIFFVFWLCSLIYPINHKKILKNWSAQKTGHIFIFKTVR